MDVIKPDSEDRIIKYDILSNKLKCISIHSKNINRSYIVACVNVGSLANKEYCDGLAHLLEHMCFITSKKYNEKNYVQNKAAEYGGYTNAYTDDLNTVYFFEVFTKNLENMVEIFSDYLFNAELKESYIKDEIKTNVKIITFGTIMENFKGIANSNAYLKSKTDYFEYLTSITVNPHNTIHLQIHTWYGGYRLHNTMFLGQIYDAIKSGKAFRMSSGLQLREYHHIEDDLEALKHLLSIDTKGILQINHGISITLKDIATHLFSHFNSLELMKIGDVATPVQENFTRKFVVPESLKGIAFRNPLEGITDYFRLLLNGESPSHHLHSKE
jgi:hypothetical protein